MLSLVSGTPGAIGIIVGGLLADRRGRKPVAFVALTLGTVLSVAFYFASGAPMWLWAIVSTDDPYMPTVLTRIDAVAQ